MFLVKVWVILGDCPPPPHGGFVRSDYERARARIAEQLLRHAVIHRALGQTEFVREAHGNEVADEGDSV